MTLAPELAGADELIAELVRCGIRVSFGHSQASSAQACLARANDSQGVTHLFNAMSGLHHRRRGLASFALLEEGLFVEIIGDLVHVGAEAIELALRSRDGDLRPANRGKRIAMHHEGEGVSQGPYDSTIRSHRFPGASS